MVVAHVGYCYMGIYGYGTRDEERTRKCLASMETSLNASKGSLAVPPVLSLLRQPVDGKRPRENRGGGVRGAR